jgi:F-type H+-transporting ATPase subunit gamma
MADLQRIRRRIRSVQTTRQITKALQMVAASKMLKAEEAAKQPQSYVQVAQALLHNLEAVADVSRSRFYESRSTGRGLIIMITADRGMAGPYNANVLRQLAVGLQGQKADAVYVGLVGAHALARVDTAEELAAYPMESSDALVAIVRPILEEAVTGFTDGTLDSVTLIYTHFESTSRQSVVSEQLLPLAAQPANRSGGITEPDAGSILDTAVLQFLEAKLLQAVLEARAAEQAARMLAMMNATDNASDLIDDLTLTYNDVRQSSITQELAEITGGAEAMNA